MTNLLALAKQWLTVHAEKPVTELPLSDRQAIRLLTHRINQVGRLNMRLRRAHAALEDALMRVHCVTAEVRGSSTSETPVSARTRSTRSSGAFSPPDKMREKRV